MTHVLQQAAIYVTSIRAMMSIMKVYWRILPVSLSGTTVIILNAQYSVKPIEQLGYFDKYGLKKMIESSI